MTENIFNLPSEQVQNETKDVLQQIANTLDVSIDTLSRMSNIEQLVTNLIDSVEDISGVGRTNETVKKNADDIVDLYDKKVEKVIGKGLSTEDYSTVDKSKLSKIEEEANKTTIANNLTETVAGKALDATQGKILKDDLVAHKEDYVQYKDTNNLKIAKVEKDINDYQSTMATMNPNQEAKQKVTGYGIVSLPKTAANGQIS